MKEWAVRIQVPSVSALGWASLIVFGACTPSGSRTVPDADLYRAAYQYLMESPRIAQYCQEDLQIEPDACRLGVIDTLVFQDYRLFARDLAQMSGRHFNQVIDSVLQADKLRREGFRSTSLRGVIAASDNPTVVAYFSPLNGNMLTAEVLGPYVVGQPYSEAARHRRSFVFLLIFNQDGRISTVLDYTFQNE